MYMDKDLIEDNLNQIIDQFSERKITHVKFYSILINEIYHFMMETVERVRYGFLIMIKNTKILMGKYF